MLLEESLAYTRSLPGTRHLRAPVVVDEVYGTLRPHPASPFLVRNVHATPNTTMLKPRWAMSFLRGPMTLGDIRRARGA